MVFSPPIRKLALLIHVTSSVAWLGAVFVFLALALAGLLSPDAQLVRSCYAVMGLVAWAVIVPACLTSLLTGLLSSLGTGWGLLSHYWVAIKLAITLIATVVLAIHLGPIVHIADLAVGPTWSADSLSGFRPQLVVEASAATGALLTATGLSVYKPPGRTSFGLRRLQRTSPRPELRPEGGASH